MTDKTAIDMERRKSELMQLKSTATLTLSTAGELDAIGHGLTAWNEYRRKHYAK